MEEFQLPPEINRAMGDSSEEVVVNYWETFCTMCLDFHTGQIFCKCSPMYHGTCRMRLPVMVSASYIFFVESSHSAGDEELP